MIPCERTTPRPSSERYSHLMLLGWGGGEEIDFCLFFSSSFLTIGHPTRVANKTKSVLYVSLLLFNLEGRDKIRRKVLKKE